MQSLMTNKREAGHYEKQEESYESKKNSVKSQARPNLPQVGEGNYRHEHKVRQRVLGQASINSC
jgi:hypothetical protein